MAQTDRDDIAVYVVWSSQLGAEERHVPRAADLLRDSRARHFWDAGQVVGGRYADMLELSSPAWDLWVLFDRDTRWQDPSGAPEPVWWAHQLNGLPDSLRLDPERFTRKATGLLDG